MGCIPDFSQINRESLFLYGKLHPLGIDKPISCSMKMTNTGRQNLYFRHESNKTLFTLRAQIPDITLADEET